MGRRLKSIARGQSVVSVFMVSLHACSKLGPVHVFNLVLNTFEICAYPALWQNGIVVPKIKETRL